MGAGRKAYITSIALDAINVNIISTIIRFLRRFSTVFLAPAAGVGRFKRVGNRGGAEGIGFRFF